MRQRGRRVSCRAASSRLDPRVVGKIGPEDAPAIRAAINSVLAHPPYQCAAAVIAAEMRGLPSVDELVDSLAG